MFDYLLLTLFSDSIKLKRIQPISSCFFKREG